MERSVALEAKGPDGAERQAEPAAPRTVHWAPQRLAAAVGNRAFTRLVRRRATAALQRQEAATAPAPAEAPAQAGKGQRLRTAALGAARGWLEPGKELMTQQQIEDIRQGIVREKFEADGRKYTIGSPGRKPMPNYTTCIEFAGQFFREGVQATAAGPQERKEMAGLLIGIKTVFDQEAGINMSLALFQGNLARHEQGLVEPEARRKALAARIEELKLEKELDPKQKAELTQKGLQLKQLDKHLDQIRGVIKKVRGDVAAQETKLAALAEKGKAWIKPTPGLPQGRPKPGEFILWAHPKGGSKAVGPAQVSLGTGAFRHISILGAKSPDDMPIEKVEGEEGVEVWHTIDGGGRTAESRKNYVRTSDLMVFRQLPSTPGAQPLFALAGWIDMSTLVGEGGTETSP